MLLRKAWEANPGSQKLFLSCTIREVLYEGTRGNGKTIALLIDFAQHCGVGFGSAWRGILFRRTYKQLDDVITKSKALFYQIFPGIRFLSSKSDYRWVWPTGEELLLRVFDSVDDYWNYHGHEYCLAEGDKIRTSRGLIPIENVRVGDLVQTLEGLRPITRIFPAKTKPCVTAYVFDDDWNLVGEQVQSEDHQLLTSETEPCRSSCVSCASDPQLPERFRSWPSYRSLGDGRQENLEPVACAADERSAGTARRPIREGVSQLVSRFGHAAQFVLQRLSSAARRLRSSGCDSLCRSREQPSDSEATRRWSDAGPRQLVAPFRSLWDCGVSRAHACEQPESCTASGWKCDSPPCRADHDERSLAALAAALDGAPSRADAARLVRVSLQPDESGSTHIRSRARCEQAYVHPYTGELRAASRQIRGAWAWLVPCGERRTIDITVETSNHYISSTGLINKNCWIGWEELTSWPDLEGYEAMLACNRSAHPGVPRKVRATTNPFGVGHNAVKKYFIDPAPRGQVYSEEREIPVLEDGEIVRRKMIVKRVAIHGSYIENPKLLVADPMYLSNLERISDPNKRKAWLFGSWDITSGGMFDDLWDSRIHVIKKSFKIPAGWRIDRSLDWGQAAPFSVGWWIESDGSPLVFEDESAHTYPRGTLIRYAEWYGCTGKANQGLGMTSTKVAQGIVERQTQMGIHGRCKPGPADGQIFNVSDETSIATNMGSEGVTWLEADKKPGSRRNGVEIMRSRLEASVKAEGRPGIYVTERCRDFLRTVPSLPRSEKDPEDVDSDAEDHAWDETMYRLIGPKPTKATVTSLRV